MIRIAILAAALTLIVCGAAPAEDKDEAKRAEKIKKLLTERRDTLRKAITGQWAKRKLGGVENLDVIMRLSKDLLQVELELATTPKERLAAHEARLETALKVDKVMAALNKKGVVSDVDALITQADRLEAEIGWLKAGGSTEKTIGLDDK
jgi:hypothetical protein